MECTARLQNCYSMVFSALAFHTTPTQIEMGQEGMFEVRRVLDTSRNMPGRKHVSFAHYLPSSGPPSDTKYKSLGEKVRSSTLPL